MNSNLPNRKVAVVVPMRDDPQLSIDERISLAHLIRHLGHYDKYLVVPSSVSVHRAGFGVKQFPDKYFGSAAANTRLMLSRTFYEAFSDYEYILIYQLDCLVFSDRLLAWCEAGYDYIGAPWFKCADARADMGFSRVGNGGFSLRRVRAFLDVFDSDEYAIDPADYWSKYIADKPRWVQLINWPRKQLKRFKVFNNVRWEMNGFARGAARQAAQKIELTLNEDRYWSLRGTTFLPNFAVAPVEMGLRFAFECEPRFCFQRNQRRLPFGCHAWPRYDRAFWEPYLLAPYEEETCALQT